MSVELNINTNDGVLNQVQKFTLDGISYFLRTYYNSRIMEGALDDQGSWFVGLYDVEDSPILTGIKVIPNRNMFALADPDGLFTGRVYCIDTIGNPEETLIDVNNFGQGNRFQLWYYSKEEVDEVLALVGT